MVGVEGKATKYKNREGDQAYLAKVLVSMAGAYHGLQNMGDAPGTILIRGFLQSAVRGDVVPVSYSVMRQPPLSVVTVSYIPRLDISR